MPCFKPVPHGLKLLPVDFDQQVMQGSCEYALCHLVDTELDFSSFHSCYRNDVTGEARLVSCRPSRTAPK